MISARRARWIRRLSAALAIALILILAGVIGVVGYLNSSSGKARLLDLIVNGVNASIQGEFHLSEIDLSGATITLRGIRLDDPEGDLVLSIDSISAHVTFWALARRQAILDQVRVDRPLLFLKQSPKGLNLSRAIASREAKPAQPEKKPPSSLVLWLKGIQLREGMVDFQRPVEKSAKGGLSSLARVRAEGITVDGDFGYLGPLEQTRAKLALGGGMSLPLRGPIDVAIDGVVDPKSVKAAGHAFLPGLSLAGSGESNPKQADVQIDSLALEPSLAQALLPEHPLQVPIRMEGRATRSQSEWTIALTASGGQARLRASGSLDLEDRQAKGLTVDASDIDLRQLVSGLPHSHLSAHLKADGNARDLGQMEGTLSLVVPKSPLGRQEVGPMEIAITANHQEAWIDRLSINLPGISVRGTGRIDGLERLAHPRTSKPPQLDFKGVGGADDLRKLAAAIGDLTGGPRPALSGRGDLTWQAEGPLFHPAVSLESDWSDFNYGTTSIAQLHLAAQLPDLLKPFELQADLSAKLVRLGQRTLNALSASVEAHGRALHADLTSNGFADLLVHLEGLLDADGKGILLSAMEISYPDNRWALQRPAHIRVEPGHVHLEPLKLSADDQSVLLALEIRKGQLEAGAQLEAVDLGRIARAFHLSPPDLAGKVTARVIAQGPLHQPIAEAHLEIADGVAFHVTQIKLMLDGRYAKELLEGKLAVTSRIFNATSDFSLPAKAFAEHRPEPIHLVFDLDTVKVEDALKALDSSLPLEGTVRGQLVLSGTATAPLGRLLLKARGITYRALPPPIIEQPNFDLVVESGHDQKVRLRLDMDAIWTGGLVEVQTPYTLARLLETPLSQAEIASAPFDAYLEVRDFPLRAVNLTHRTPPLKGRLSVRAEAHGSIRAPLLNLEIDGRQVQTPSSPATDLSIRAIAAERKTEAWIHATRADASILDLAAAIEGGLTAIQRPEKLAQLPLKGEGKIGPLALSEIRPYLHDASGKPRPLPDGVVAANLALSGTLSQPRIHLASTADDLMIADRCLGNAEAIYDYQAAQSKLDLRLRSQGGGQLHAAGSVRLDLSYPSVQRGLPLDSAAIDLGYVADRFDLAFFNGLVPSIHAIGGTLRAEGTVKGTVKDPKQEGSAEWKDGLLTLVGYGEHRDIHAVASWTNDNVEIRELAMKSGEGHLHLTGLAQRETEETFSLSAWVDMVHFPIIYDDQLYASATMAVRLSGEATPTQVSIRPLSIPRAEIDLPQVSRKDVQDLDRPPDIVVIRPIAPAKVERPPPDTGDRSGGGEPKRRYVIVVDAPKNLFVRGPDEDLELGLSEGFRIEYQDKTAMYGEVHFLGGRGLVLLGRKLEIRPDSQVRFAGSAKRPYLNLVAIYRNDREQVTVYVAVHGQGKDFTIKPTSDPPLSEAEIYTLLATGRRTLKRGSGTSMTQQDAASAIGSYLATELKNSIQPKLGPLDLKVDVLSIESGETGRSSTKVEAGKYLSDQLYLGYAYRIGADPIKENPHAVKLEYQLSHRMSLEGEYGTNRVGGADLIWSHDY